MNASPSARKSSVRSLTALLFLLALMALFLIFSSVASQAVLAAMTLCYRTLIPSLFPCLVLTGLLTKSGAVRSVGRLLGRPFRALFGVSAACAVPTLLGALCGFPTGAAAVSSLYVERQIEKEDAEKALLLSSSASPAFLIVGVGAGMLASPERGLYLYLIQLTALFVITALLSFLGTRKKEAVPVPTPVTATPRPFAACFSEAVREAVDHILTICGSVIFFSVLAGFFLSLHGLPKPLLCLLVGACELTSGASTTASLLRGDLAFVVLAALCGWSGGSVHTQIAAVTEGRLSLKRYLLGKAAASLLCALLATLLISSRVV